MPTKLHRENDERQLRPANNNNIGDWFPFDEARHWHEKAVFVYSPRASEADALDSSLQENRTPLASSWHATEEGTIFDDDDDGDFFSRSKPSTSLCCTTKRQFWLATSSCLLAVVALFGVGMIVGKAQGHEPFALLRRDGRPPSSLAPSSSMSPTLSPSSSPTDSPVPTESPSSAPTYIPVKPSKITVGVYYYPWYYDDFHVDGGYLREQLDPPQLPVLGEYNDQESSVITQHLAWSRQANVQLWVTSWWGPDRREDIATLKILQHRDLGANKIALLYETTGRILKKEGPTTKNIVPDIGYMCEHYFQDEHYFTIDGRPVLFVYSTRKLYKLGLLQEVVALMRGAAASYGHDPYIIGDQVFSEAPFGEEGVYSPFADLDGVTGYDTYGTIMLDNDDDEFYAGDVTNYTRRSQDWKRLAELQSCTFVPCVTPGFNDRGVREHVDHGPLSRRINTTAEPGSLFRALLEQARYFVDESTSNLLLVNSFNEWHEDTQIEPTVVGTSTTIPFSMTQGVEYEGYGDLYLNILREMTEDQDVTASTGGGGVDIAEFVLNVNISNIFLFASSASSGSSNATNG
jgi:glycoprotein endo-alpha-1,2-mannosidase